MSLSSPRDDRAILQRSVASVLGEPTAVDDVLLWDVRGPALMGVSSVARANPLTGAGRHRLAQWPSPIRCAR